MIQLAKLYQDHLLRPFRQQKCHTPTPSYHPSHPSFEDERYFYADIADSAPKDHSQAKQQALFRDGFQCMVTRVFDDRYVESLTPEQQAALPLTAPPQPTNACHIFPPSTNTGLDPEKEGHPKTHYAANVWSIVNNFGGIRLEDELNGDQIHRLSNIMTMSQSTHSMFDTLRLWFEAVPTLATYDICATLPLYLINITRRVTFTATKANLERPDRRYLRLHAAVCRVAYMSGAAEYLDRCDREHEDRKVLARDGSSAEFLTTRLQRVFLVA
ncbi:hypothetical protein FIBSPDRAFT_840587 [Athelia psychrophila]|uniref:HNH nuclease domain-containing protein n=1 Tax=Athelia psychrophila TaxID=1759441 RepID=A0A165X0C9_9AGAM|nr:hypothetical protein FIBSPDRAFT_840587 [Fibularhizoctonia sp. CBS 109695]